MEGNKKPSAISLKVMSFNIAHGLGMDNIVDLEKTASVIEQSGSEIIGLQEVDRYFTERSSFIDQVDWLSRRLGMYAGYGPNLNLDPIEPERPRRQYGNAILSKYPIKYVENHLLAEVASPIVHSEQRGILEAVIEVNGVYLNFYNTHLSLNDEELKVNIDEILVLLNKSRFPKVLTGDFNAAPDHPQIKRIERQFNDVFKDLDKDNAYTYPSAYKNINDGVELKPVTRIDYIFTDSHLLVKNASVLETAVSDHLPIVAELVLTRKVNRVKSAAGMPNKKMKL